MPIYTRYGTPVKILDAEYDEWHIVWVHCQVMFVGNEHTFRVDNLIADKGWDEIAEALKAVGFKFE